MCLCMYNCVCLHKASHASDERLNLIKRRMKRQHFCEYHICKWSGMATINLRQSNACASQIAFDKLLPFFHSFSTVLTLELTGTIKIVKIVDRRKTSAKHKVSFDRTLFHRCCFCCPCSFSPSNRWKRTKLFCSSWDEQFCLKGIRSHVHTPCWSKIHSHR